MGADGAAAARAHSVHDVTATQCDRHSLRSLRALASSAIIVASYDYFIYLLVRFCVGRFSEPTPDCLDLRARIRCSPPTLMSI